MADAVLIRAVLDVTSHGRASEATGASRQGGRRDVGCRQSSLYQFKRS
jgi:hypothetical protein